MSIKKEETDDIDLVPTTAQWRDNEDQRRGVPPRIIPQQQAGRAPDDSNMADGLNHVRAIRIAELMKDFHDIQTQLANTALPAAAETSNEEGFSLMRECRAQSWALLRQPFENNGRSSNDEEKKKTHLQRIITDAAVRRFRAWKIYMYLNAALRWSQARDAYLGGARPDARHAQGLSELQQRLRAEISSITDIRVEAECRRKDMAEGKWLAEDPPSSFIQSYTGTSR